MKTGTAWPSQEGGAAHASHTTTNGEMNSLNVGVGQAKVV